jgi:hypothetical protein
LDVLDSDVDDESDLVELVSDPESVEGEDVVFEGDPPSDLRT